MVSGNDRCMSDENGDKDTARFGGQQQQGRTEDPKGGDGRREGWVEEEGCVGSRVVFKRRPLSS